MFSASLQATKDAPIAINFDAWGRDFSENPFASFCDEIHRELVKHDETKGVERASKFLQKAKGVLGTMIGGSIRVGSTFATAFAAVHSGGDPQVAASAAKAADQVAKGIADKLQEAAHKAPDARAAFRLVLNKIVTELQSEGDHAGKCQFIIFVDELDRCRPDFAMRLLETIKHFFDIPGITFVLAYDEMFLSSAAKSLYGPSFDADNYLRRFIDVRFWLPQNEQTSFAFELLKRYGIPSHAPGGVELHRFLNDTIEMLELGLRDIEQALAACKLFLTEFPRLGDSVMLPCLFICVYRFASPEKAKGVVSGKVTFLEVISDLRDGFKKRLGQPTWDWFATLLEYADADQTRLRGVTARTAGDAMIITSEAQREAGHIPYGQVWRNYLKVLR
jgi:hypothetical protein